MSMREKIARALQANGAEGSWTDLLSDADAALDALLEPTEGMVEDGQVEVNLLENPEPPNAFKFLSNDEVVLIWQAMVRAAQEGK